MPQESFDFKQVIAVRTDLKMGKGKLAVQVSHAAVSTSEEARKKYSKWWQSWIREGQCKVVVKVKNLNELLELQREVIEMGLPHSLITDRGLTQLPPSTITCLGIGPAPSLQVDKVTKSLQLL
ncbi:MAG: peptidyl-tRNA hydrolase [Candidatus Bathyarchaeota archaeon]|nr:MAG: peptidyl-tRNA hydrolase [Candidatus Bathyarchaeota archaeon]